MLFLTHLIFLLGHDVHDGIDDDTGPVDDICDDVNGGELDVFIKLEKIKFIKFCPEMIPSREFLQF